MRSRAEAENSRGWYKVDFNEGDDPMYCPLWGVSNDVYFNPPADDDAPWLAVEVHTGTEATAEHIASWHPAVALAVADWLDDLYDRITDTDYDEDDDLAAALRGEVDVADWPEVHRALAVATTYLGRAS